MLFYEIHELCGAWARHCLHQMRLPFFARHLSILRLIDWQRLMIVDWEMLSHALLIASISSGIVCGSIEEFQTSPLGSKTMKHMINEMSIDIEDQVVQDLGESAQPFSLQLDEPTGEASCCQLLAYVRYVS